MRPLLAVLVSTAAAVSATPARATWSILLVDTRTKEIAIGSATCITNFDLRVWTPVLLAGRGAATAQSFVDSTGRNRLLIFTELKKGTSPAKILQLLAKQDPGHQTRQYGIVDAAGNAVTFTGTRASAWAGGVTGRIGDVVYAVQGNILTGAPVVQKAVAAIRATKGDLAAKLMAGMEAARSMGGDRRCSCSGSPTGCGSPPKSFQKSAHVGYMLIARQGDTDGSCNLAVGCASGSYYMALNVANQRAPDADPVRQLRLLYDYWRLSLVGRPDHHLSTVALKTAGLPADGRTTTAAVITLKDWRGLPVKAANVKVTVSLDPASSAAVTIGTPVSKGGGVFEVPLKAGRSPGLALLRVVADDGKGKVLLSPRTRVPVVASPLWVSVGAVDARTGGRADFVLQPGVRLRNRLYLLLASTSGSRPGIRLPGNLVIPINPDAFFGWFLHLANRAPLLERSFGRFDGTGWANAVFRIPAGVLGPLKGRRLTFTFATIKPIDFAGNAVEVPIR